MAEHLISNNSTSPTSTVEFTSSPAANLTAAVLLGLYFVLGTLGNVTVLALLLRNLEQNNFTHLLMLNLVCCDLLCLTILPAWIVDTLRQRDLSYGLCKFITFVTFCSHYANLYIITLMSVHRYMTVFHRHRWARMGQAGERALLVGLWGVSCFMTWPSVGSFGRVKDGHFDCSRLPRMEGKTLAATVLDLSFGFAVPFSVMTSFYICLYRKVKERALSSCKRTSQLISRIIVTFVALWVPIHIVGVVGLVGASLRTSQPGAAFELECFTDTFEVKMVYIFPLFRLVIDPFLYAFSFRKIWPRNRDNEDVILQANAL